MTQAEQIYIAQVDRLAAVLKALAPKLAVSGGYSMRERCDAADTFGEGLSLASAALDELLFAVIVNADSEIGAINKQRLASIVTDALQDADILSDFTTFSTRAFEHGEAA